MAVDSCKEMESADSSRTADADIETGKVESPEDIDGIGGSLIRQLQRAVCRETNLEIGGKLMQLLLKYCLMFQKFTSRDKSPLESPRDAPNHRCRRFKRSISFDSRKIVLLFSALSSMGTMALIYLTLKVNHTGDGFVHA